MMIKYWFITILLIFNLGTMFKADAAYIYYQVKGDSPQIANDKMAKLVGFIIYYQYPMSIAYFQDTSIRPASRNKDILYLSHHTEGEFLNKKIQEYQERGQNLFEDIRAVFIPDTLFHYIYLYYYYYDPEIKNLTEALKKEVDSSFQKIEVMAQFGQQEMTEYYDYFMGIHRSPLFIQLFTALNQRLVTLVFDTLGLGESRQSKSDEKSEISDQSEFNLNESHLNQHYLTISKYLRVNLPPVKISIKEEYKGEDGFFRNLTKDIKKQNLLHKTMRQEYQSYQNHSILLFRGTDIKNTGIVDSIALVDTSRSIKHPAIVSCSLSYGTSFLGGLIYEPSACAFSHMNKKTFGYALEFNLANVLNNRYDFIYIPPLSPVITLSIGMAEFWHARTKLGAFCNFGRESCHLIMRQVCGVAASENVGQNIKHQGVIVTPKATILLARSFSKYLEDHLIVLHNTSSNEGWKIAQKAHTMELSRAAEKIGKVHKK